MSGPAIVQDGRIVTRAELGDLVERMVEDLEDLTAGRRPERVAWMMHNRVEVIVLALATRQLGAVVTPLSYRATASEVSRMIRVARPDVVVTEAATTATVLEAGREVDHPFDVLDVDRDPRVGARPRRPVSVVPGLGPVLSDRLGAGASMLFTSGTSGEPKAALRTRGNPALAAAIADRLGFSAESRFLAAGPLYHSGPWTCALMALSRGGVVVVGRRFQAAEWLATAGAHGVTASFVTPTQLRLLVDAVADGHRAPATLRNVVVSGESFPPELKHRATRALGPCLVDCYGCTELGPLACMPAEELLIRPTSAGRPFPGVELAAFDRRRRLPPGEVGVLHARTPLAFDGYVGGVTTARVGPGDGWLSVGDVGRVDVEGWVHLVGRADDMIISGGVNVFPDDVEAVLAAHPAIRQCAVVGLPDPVWGQVVATAVVSDAPPTIDELRDWLRTRIADDKRPRRLFHLDALPITQTGKISRHQLRQQLLAGAAPGAASPAP